MTEGHRDGTPDVAAGVPDAVVETGSGFSLVWVIPLVAALVAAFLTWNAISERGPTITISFVSAEGLEAGKTQVKFKDVVVGSVESIEIAKDMLHVLVLDDVPSDVPR